VVLGRDSAHYIALLKKNKKLPPFFICLKVALGAQEAPQKKLELSFIGKAKIDQGFLKGSLCAGAL
jgi:hypothetical protein